MNTTSSHTFWGAYFVVQTLLCALWWFAILSSDQMAAYFAPDQAHAVSYLRMFWLADLICVVGGSALCAMTIFARHRLIQQALWWTSGAITFASLYCVALWLDTQQAGLCVVLMVPATLMTVCAAQLLTDS